MVRSTEGRIARDARVVVVEHGREAVMIDVGRGRRFTLNPLGARIWAALEAEPTFPELIEQLWNQYDVRAEVLARDVAAMLARWNESGLIIWRE